MARILFWATTTYNKIIVEKLTIYGEKFKSYFKYFLWATKTVFYFDLKALREQTISNTARSVECVFKLIQGGWTIFQQMHIQELYLKWHLQHKDEHLFDEIPTISGEIDKDDVPENVLKHSFYIFFICVSPCKLYLTKFYGMRVKGDEFVNR